MKLDILVLAVHPDDAELSCSGTIVSHIHQGKKVGIVDFTKGELGTRGNAELRMKEAAKAAKIMGLSSRENLGFADGFFENNKEHQLEIIKRIRKYQPELILANAIEDRHPDHGRAAKLANDAIFLSGLKKIKTEFEGKNQEAWRPSRVFNYIQSNYIKPDFVVDISGFWEQKKAAILAFQSQFHQEGTGAAGDQTFISTPGFMEFIKARAKEYGQHVGVELAEGFTSPKPLAINSLFDFI